MENTIGWILLSIGVFYFIRMVYQDYAYRNVLPSRTPPPLTLKDIGGDMLVLLFLTAITLPF